MSFDISEENKLQEARPSRRTYTGLFKAQVVVEAITNKRNIKELAACYGVHPNQIKNWKCILLKRMDELFEDKRRVRGRRKDRVSKQRVCVEENHEVSDVSRHHPEQQVNNHSTVLQETAGVVAQ